MENTAHNKELTTLAHRWLALTGNRLHSKYCRETIASHPDYPALTALTDFLESGGMTYEAVQADASYIHEFSYPLLAHIKQSGDEYLYLVTDIGAWERERDATKHWSGIALYAAPNAVWHHPEHDQYQKVQQRNKVMMAVGILMGILLLAAAVYNYPNVLTSIFGVLSFAGLAVSLAAAGTELGYQNKLAKQVCGAAGHSGCEKVLNSKFAKGIAGITPADASLLYFASQFATYLTGCFYLPILNGTIPVAGLGLLAIAWSIYTQAFKLKQWCALCLCIALVLLLQSLIAIVLSYQGIKIVGNYPYLFFPLVAALLTLFFIPVKQLIKTNNRYRQELNSFKKWKTDIALFRNQLEQEPVADITPWENDLLLGYTEAPLRITVACNPYCGPCAKAHKILDDLLMRYPGKISVQVRLLCDTGKEADRRTMATKAILQQAVVLKDNTALQQMLTDWFQWMDLDRWRRQWSQGQQIQVMTALQQHEAWMNQTGITHTPTFFINGRKMPGRYDLKDMEPMIPQLTELFVVQ